VKCFILVHTTDVKLCVTNFAGVVQGTVKVSAWGYSRHYPN